MAGTTRNRARAETMPLPDPLSPTLTGGSSSPPRGLRESYERILDEENLAAEESGLVDILGESLEGSEGAIGDWVTAATMARSGVATATAQSRSAGGSGSERSQRFPRGYGDGVSRSPISQRMFAHSPSRGVPEDGSSGGSIVSGPSSLGEGSNNSSERNYAQHVRDQQRIRNLMRDDTKLFSKARRRDRPGTLSTENLQRRTENKPQSRLSRESRNLHSYRGMSESKLDIVGNVGDSLNSHASDPPLNLPRQWGKRGRRGGDWLSKVADLEKENEEAKTSRATPKQNFTRPWPSRKDEESLQKSSPYRSNLSFSIDSIPADQLDDEFTARSLQVSTSPPLRPRPKSSGALDEIREAETEAFKLEKSNAENHRRQPSPPKRSTERSYLNGTSKYPTPESEGAPIPHSPVVIYKRSPSQEPHGTRSETQRSDHDREKKPSPLGQEISNHKDSHDLLKRLSKAASSSPSPSHEDRNAVARKELMPGKPASESPTKGSNDRKDVKPYQKTPSRSSAAISKNVKATPAIQIGGWVDTPATLRPRPGNTPASSIRDRKSIETKDTKTREKSSTMKPEAASKREPRETAAIRTANREHVKAHAPQSLSRSSSLPDLKTATQKPTAFKVLEDSDSDATSDSLEKLMANDKGFASLLGTSASSSEQGDKADSSALLVQAAAEQNMSPSEKRRQAESLSYDRLQKSVGKLRVNLHMTNRGIEQLENRIEQSGSSLTKDGHTHHSSVKWQCPQCGLGVQPPLECTRFHLFTWPPKNPLPQIWYWDSKGWPRLTRFGVIWVLGWTYVLSELIVCEFHCRVIYASKTSLPFGIDRWAVDPPFVTIKYIHKRYPWVLQPFTSVLRYYWLFIRFIWRFLVGIINAIFDADGGPASRMASSTYSNPQRPPPPRPPPRAWDEQWIVGEDEYI